MTTQPTSRHPPVGRTTTSKNNNKNSRTVILSKVNQFIKSHGSVFWFKFLKNNQVNRSKPHPHQHDTAFLLSFYNSTAQSKTKTTKPRRQKKTNDAEDHRLRKTIKDLFIQAMKKICSTKDDCFPFNVSKIDVEMRKLNSLYSISNTPFGRFSILVQQMVQEGHCIVGRCGGGPLNCVDSKYAQAKNLKFEKVSSSV